MNENALGDLDTQIAATSVALKALEAPATESADAIDQAFAKAGASLAQSLSKAASDGKISLGELASALISAVDAAGGGSSSGGLGTVLSSLLSSAFSGARADGGAVSGGGAYLVGERGPEVFRPSGSGVIEASGASPTVNVTLNMASSAQGLVRSEAQLATAIHRAARLGVR